ncbi:MAG: hypothetical protein Q8754_03000, partial [Sweet potato little leaf phytoplasma]|nr:hypothetical protein [Sweet potato little leaf phytoplasma]
EERRRQVVGLLATGQRHDVRERVAGGEKKKREREETYAGFNVEGKKKLTAAGEGFSAKRNTQRAVLAAKTRKREGKDDLGQR